MSVLTATAFELLIARFETDQKLFPLAAGAAEKYELLRQKLIKCLIWKGCPESEADSIADTALDRVALKISRGEQIENLKAYACEVLRFVWLEHLKKRREITVGDENFPEVVSQPNVGIFEEDERLRCLRSCLAKLEDQPANSEEGAPVSPRPDNRRLITGYYDLEAGEKLKEIRKKLAEEMGYPMGNADEIKRAMTRLKVRAFHLRERLEKCINECVGKLTAVTETTVSDTLQRGGRARP